MKNFKDTILFLKENEIEENSQLIEELSKKKSQFVWVKKTNENKIELFWNKTLDNIISINKIENHFKNLFSVVNPNSQFIKKSLNRNISTIKCFYRPNKKSSVLDIGFFSQFMKELKKGIESPKSIVDKELNKTLWLIDSACMEDYDSQYSEEYIRKWLSENYQHFKYKPYPHQELFLTEGAKYSKRLLVSNTGTGKSFSIILTWWFYRSHFKSIKTLLIVPNIQLLNQFEDEFRAHFPDLKILKIGGDNAKVFGYGKDEYLDINKTKWDIVISTYQSLDVDREGISDNVKAFLKCFGKDKHKGLVIVDECHKAKASTIQDILSHMDSCQYRKGTTGTLLNYSNNKWDEYHLYRYMRAGAKEITRIEQMEKENIVTPLDFHFVYMRGYSEIPAYKVLSYAEEVEYLCNSEERRNSVVELIKEKYDPKKNYILFFNRKDIGKPLFFDLLKEFKDKTFYISGETDQQLRENIKNKIETSTGNLLIASIGTSSTGINYKNVHGAFFLQISKSDIIIFQSMGRMQRLFEGKDKADIYFICDKFANYNNYSYTHMKSIIKSLEAHFSKERIQKALDENTIEKKLDN